MRSIAPRLSAFVVSHNRAASIGLCLQALRFADELIVLDKSSTDTTPDIARCLADRVITVPGPEPDGHQAGESWSQRARSIADARARALEHCTHDWILFLDDDECLSPEAAYFLRCELEAPRADVYALPLSDQATGPHDADASQRNTPQVRCFRRGTVGFSPSGSGGIEVRSGRVMRVTPEAGVCIHRLTHPDAAFWLGRPFRAHAHSRQWWVQDNGAEPARPSSHRFEHCDGRRDGHRLDHRFRQPAPSPATGSRVAACDKGMPWAIS